MLPWNISVKLRYQNILEMKVCLVFLSQAEANVSITSFYKAELNIEEIEFG